MKIIPTESDLWQVTSDKMTNAPRRASRFTPHVSRLTPRASRITPHVSRLTPRASAFTIIELLVVIAIIATLAALLLPVLAKARIAAQKKQAAMDISQIVTAIQQYDSAYGRFPVSAQAQQAAGAGNNGNFDFTYGAVFQTPAGPALPSNLLNPIYPMSNSEVIAILMDFTNYPNNGSVSTINTNHQKNPQHTAFLTAKMSGWDPSQAGLPVAGVGNDLVYRDPWGNPYVISMDLNYDDQCQDAFYCLSAVSNPNPIPPGAANGSPGLNGLINPDGTPNNYRYHGTIMVWSAGPDKMIDTTALPAAVGNAKFGANKDNILSWQ